MNFVHVPSYVWRKGTFWKKLCIRQQILLSEEHRDIMILPNAVENSDEGTTSGDDDTQEPGHVATEPGREVAMRLARPKDNFLWLCLATISSYLYVVPSIFSEHIWPNIRITRYV